MTYFKNCKTLQQLKIEYKHLVKMHHPDNGGSDEVIKAINADYERLKKILPDMDLDEKQQEINENTADQAGLSEALKNILEKVSKIPGIIIEVCGSWIWVSGNTYSVKDILKNLGFKFSGKKKMWYFREETEGCKTRYKRKERTMEDIRDLYGSEKVSYRGAAALS